MPFYDFKCDECSYTFEEFQTILNIDVPLEQPCPSCYKVGYISRLVYAAEICEPQRVGVRKVPSGYKEVIKNIKKHHPGNTIELRE